MSQPGASAAPTVGPEQLALRRLILYGLLFALVVVAAVGLSGLLDRLLARDAVLVSADVTELARALAFTLIGGPLAALLWWVVWRRLGNGAERRSDGWGLYLSAVYTVSLIVFVTSLLSTVTSLIGRFGATWWSSLSTGLVWLLVWVWHRWMWRHPAKSPTSLEDVPAVIGSVYGLVLGGSFAIAALGGLLDVALSGYTSLIPRTESWWQPVLRALVWAIGGTLVWWWHWYPGGGRRLTTPLASIALVGVGIFTAGVVALGAAGTALFVLLRTVFDSTGHVGEVLAPLGPAVATVVIGALVWRYHRVVADRHPLGVRRAGILVTSGVALAAAASGIGVIINATLAITVSPLVGSGSRTLLLAGLSALAVGGPVWWRTWKPTRPPRSAASIPPGRRVYLVAFFGISAVVSVIALLVIGYRLFEFVLGDVSGSSFVDRIRGPLGLLVAAALVAGYHFALWRRERVLLAAVSRDRPVAVEQVTLVAGPAYDGLSRAVAEATGARVTSWRRADTGTDATVPGPIAPDDVVRRVVEALAGVTSRHVLIVVAPAGGKDIGIDVIPFEQGGRTR
ncbi:DUF5671 domain-containing protein [Arthrobacter sp. NPDC092385]|uniref:DUF5671 domain-containing protein n=1 Tax=Arthrobacter sp. NPDC092385 TaxID=3363943 RepID=UPI0038265CBF